MEKAHNHPQGKVSKGQDAPEQSPINFKEIPKIVVCPPTPKLMEAISEATPLTTILGDVSIEVTKQDPRKATNLKVKFGPYSFYTDIESGKYCLHCGKRHQNICVHEVVVGLKRGTMFTAHVSNKRCHTLVDTSTSHSCMSLAFYEQMSLPPVKRPISTTVQSATGSNLEPLGIVECNVRLGHKTFNNTIIVCHNMQKPLILGEDFLSNNALGVYYDEQGKRHLEYKHKEGLITSIEMNEDPKVILRRVCTIPEQSLAVLNVRSTIDKQHEGRVYIVLADESLGDEHPNLIVIPSLHWVECVETDLLPYVVVNIGQE